MKYLLIVLALVFFSGCNAEKTEDKINEYLNSDDNATQSIEQFTSNINTNLYDLDLIDYVFPDGNKTKAWDKRVGEKVWLPDATYLNVYSMQEIVHSRDQNVSLVSDVPVLTTGTITADNTNVTITDTVATVTHSRYMSAEVEFTYNPKFDTCKYSPKAWKSFTLDSYSYNDIERIYCKKDDVGYHLFFQKGLGLAFYYTSGNEWYFSY